MNPLLTKMKKWNFQILRILKNKVANENNIEKKDLNYFLLNASEKKRKIEENV